MTRRVVFISGATSGIGRAIATDLAALGWAIAIGARGVDRLEGSAAEVIAAGGKAFTHVLDITDPESVDAFFDAATAALGPVDVLINNAGSSKPSRFEDLSAADLEREIVTNLLGPMYLTRRAMGSLLERGDGGDIVFVSSDAAYRPRPRMVTYTAAKSGLEGMARALSMELEGTGIRVATVRVGPTLSEFGASWDMEQIEELLAYWRRFGLHRHDGLMEPATVANAVRFVLTSPPGTLLNAVEVQPTPPWPT